MNNKFDKVWKFQDQMIDIFHFLNLSVSSSLLPGVLGNVNLHLFLLHTCLNRARLLFTGKSKNIFLDASILTHVCHNFPLINESLNSGSKEERFWQTIECLHWTTQSALIQIYGDILGKRAKYYHAYFLGLGGGGWVGGNIGDYRSNSGSGIFFCNDDWTLPSWKTRWHSEIISLYLEGHGTDDTSGIVAAVETLVACEMAIARAVPPIVMEANSSLFEHSAMNALCNATWSCKEINKSVRRNIDEISLRPTRRDKNMLSELCIKQWPFISLRGHQYWPRNISMLNIYHSFQSTTPGKFGCAASHRNWSTTEMSIYSTNPRQTFHGHPPVQDDQTSVRTTKLSPKDD